MRYYAVKQGRQPGIYTTWDECKEQINQYSGAVYKSFDNMAAAEEFMQPDPAPQPINENLPFAYVDGTYSTKTGFYGYGGFICNAGRYHIIQGTGNNAQYIENRNAAGEVIGALQVMFKAQQLNIAEMNLYFDFAGIEQWVNGNWQAVTPLAQYYQQTAHIMQTFIDIHFIKVKGHTGIEGNEIADYLAKEAAGIQLRKKDIAALANFKAMAAASETEQPAAI